MFRGAFNRTPFNRGSVIVYGSFALDAALNVTVTPSVVLQTGFILDVSTDFIFNSLRERFVQFVLEATNSIEIASSMDVTGKFEMRAELSTSVVAGRNHVDVFEFNGSFAPGDQVIIDAAALKVTQNGDNILHLFSGEPFDLNVGDNSLLYTDNQSGRTVRIRITERDKYL